MNQQKDILITLSDAWALAERIGLFRKNYSGSFHSELYAAQVSAINAANYLADAVSVIQREERFGSTGPTKIK